jgi:hypothetical protein
MAAVVLCAAPAVSAAAAPPNLPWPQLLPALPSSKGGPPPPVDGCRRATLACVDRVIARLDAVLRGFGCDHRAVFALTYERLTEAIRETLVNEPQFFRYRAWLIKLDVEFANFYFGTLANDAAGRPIPPAWRIAFDAARAGDYVGDQDLVAGINAHVQNDMAFAEAILGLRTAGGVSRKPDHDAMNQVLANAYERIVDEVAARFDPLVGTINSPLTPIDDIGGLELVKSWREGVWRNAERLVEARSDAERAQIAAQIQTNAALWAQGVFAVPAPGYGATRDAYCTTRNETRAPVPPVGVAVSR